MTEIIVPTKQKVQTLIAKGKCMLFLRGTPEFPIDYGSKQMMQVLSKYKDFVKRIDYFDLTSDEQISKALLAYANFGSIPQLYIDG